MATCLRTYRDERRRIQIERERERERERENGYADELRELYENAGSRKARERSRACSRISPRYNNLVRKICAQTRPDTALPWDFMGIGTQASWLASGRTLLYGTDR